MKNYPDMPIVDYSSKQVIDNKIKGKSHYNKCEKILVLRWKIFVVWGEFVGFEYKIFLIIIVCELWNSQLYIYLLFTLIFSSLKSHHYLDLLKPFKK